ncbi:Ig-like domain-containing protein [Brevibacillus fortis]|nr:Ig-like domain-containing protein [Brevibacillus fortis]
MAVASRFSRSIKLLLCSVGMFMILLLGVPLSASTVSAIDQIDHTAQTSFGLSALSPTDLSITMSHEGNIGGHNGIYTITVTNAEGSEASTGHVEVTVNLPEGLATVNMRGTGWICDNNRTCSHSNPIPGGAAYESITLQVRVLDGAPRTVTNQATVSGGNDSNPSNNTASDPTTIVTKITGQSYHPKVLREEETLEYTIFFTSKVSVLGTPTLPMEIGSSNVKANYIRGSGGNWLTFAYKIEKGMNDHDGVSIGNSIDLDGGSITDHLNYPVEVSISGGKAMNVDTSPIVTSVDVPGSGIYRVGDKLTFKVNYSEPVSMQLTTNGHLELTVGTQLKQALYESGTGSNTLVFSYTVQPGDRDANGITLDTNMVLDGGAMQDGTGNPADLLLTGVGDTSGIIIAPPPQAPVAVDDTYRANEDTQLTVAAPGVLANDTDADGDSLTALLVTDPSKGTLTLNADGSFTYTPHANETGTDTFTYKTNDGKADSNVAMVTVTINPAPPINQVPVAAEDTYSTNENTPLTVATPGVLTNDTDADGDSLTAILVTDPSKGTLTLTADGSFTYTPHANETGTDTFTYKTNDGKADSNMATVTVRIKRIIIPPTEPSYYPVTGISLDEEQLILSVGEDVTLKATITPSYATNQKVRWKSSNPKVAEVDDEGRVTAKREGKTTITVTSVDGDKEATLEVRVSDEADDSLQLESTEKMFWIRPYSSVRFKVYAVIDGKRRDITNDKETSYDIDNDLASLIKPGRLKVGETEGESVITVHYRGEKLEIPVTISKLSVRSLTANIQKAVLVVDEERELEVNALLSNKQSDEVTKFVQWSSRNPKVADVTKEGVLLAKKPGTVVLTGKYANKEVRLSILVMEEKVVDRLEAYRSSFYLEPEESRSVPVHAVYGKGFKEEVTADAEWTSDDPEIATVDADGTITALAEGSTTITVSYGGKEIQLKIVVSE